MDLTNQGVNQPQQASNPNNARPVAAHGGHQDKKPSKFKRIRDHKALKVVYISLLFSITVLIVGVVSSLFLFDGDRNKESRFVDTGKYQAVFLNGGQVYFGKINDLNDSYIALSNIYYLQVNQSVQPDDKSSANNFTLAKLGCELHRPQDTMIIKQDQVIFWENLKDDDSQNTVPGGIKKLAETDQGKNCQQAAQPANNNSNTNTTNTPAANSENQ